MAMSSTSSQVSNRAPRSSSMSQTACGRVRKYTPKLPPAVFKRTPRRIANHLNRTRSRLGVSTMKILIRIISVALLPCSFLLSTAAMAQDPITKTPIPDQDLRDDPLLKAKRLPVPPPPDLTRVGVEGGELTLTLNEAIRRALESNNDIEVSRDNVRLAESTLRSFEGVYDPIITLAPQFSLVRTPRVNSAGETTTIPASVPIQQTSWSITPALTKQFSTGGGQYQFFFNSQRGTSNQGFATEPILLNGNWCYVHPASFTESLDRSVPARHTGSAQMAYSIGCRFSSPGD